MINLPCFLFLAIVQVFSIFNLFIFIIASYSKLARNMQYNILGLGVVKGSIPILLVREEKKALFPSSHSIL